MDIQGTRYHLLHGKEDWARCVGEDGAPLSESFAVDDAPGPAPSGVPRSPLVFDEAGDALRLRRELPAFLLAGRIAPLPTAARRGAGRDAYGDWYRIDDDERGIVRLAAGERVSRPWWNAADPARSCADRPGAAFGTCAPGTAPDLLLRGLAVTTGQLLVAGFLGGPLGNGLLVFDLRTGGEPARMPWPAGVPFEPWDLADTPDGGLLVLDRVHAVFWRFDARLRTRGRVGHRIPLFGPADGGEPACSSLPGPALPAGVPITVPGAWTGIDPVAIEPGPGGGVLVLDSEEVRGYSLVHLVADDGALWSVPLVDVVDGVDPQDPTSTPFPVSLLGHDFAYVPGPLSPGPDAAPLLHVVDRHGKQVIAFDLLPRDPGGPLPGPFTLRARLDFLPLRRFGGRAVVRAGRDLFYDHRDRWVPVTAFTECRFARRGAFVTPTGFGEGVPAGAPFDSAIPGCVWHRFLLDAEIPAGTQVLVRARAADDPDLLAHHPWIAQPVPYRRSDGPELPWFDAWPDRQAGGGTWELLFQQVVGRYLQLEVTVTGNGRSAPLLRSLRVWFPRFSYVEHYLPAVYAEADAPGRFLERFLANVEGWFTGHEERIEHSSLVLDARTAPAADLEWLASWFALVLDPRWDTARRRFLVRHVDRFYRMRGTVPGLIATLRTYLGDRLDERVFTAAVEPGARDPAAGGVRVVERFLARVPPDPAAPPDVALAAVAGAAHRFEVLVPSTSDAATADMVARIVESARPAHALCEVGSYVAEFVVGTARLGLDSALGDGVAFAATVLGRDRLGGGYLGYPYPYDVPDRVVVDRDRLGDMPPL